MSSKHTLGRLVALGLVVGACSAAPAAAITDPPARIGTPSAASYYTPEALKAEALRWEAMAQFYGASSRPDDRADGRTTGESTRVQMQVTRTGFDWGDAGVGAATGFIFAAFAAVGLTLARRQRLAL
jgi:hypothetical protein